MTMNSESLKDLLVAENKKKIRKLQEEVTDLKKKLKDSLSEVEGTKREMVLDLVKKIISDTVKIERLSWDNRSLFMRTIEKD